MQGMLWIAVAVWVAHAVFGRRWRIAPRLTPAPPRLPIAERVVAVVPARNEADEIPRTLDALLTQRHASLHVVLVDDDSHDGTADVARTIAARLDASDRLTVLRGTPLPAGWAGKVWAQHQGVQHAATLDPAWIWLTDADIRHDPDVLERLLATAYTEHRDFVSIMARLRCTSPFEKLLIPAFTYFFATLYSFEATGNERSAAAGGAGGCILVRRPLLDRIGGMAAIRNAVIDDCAIASACKRAGGRLWIGYDPGVNSTRGYASLHAIWDMVARSAYTQLHYNPFVLIGCVAGLAYIFLLPTAALAFGSGRTRLLGLVAWAAMTRTYLPMVTYLGCARWWAALLPVSATLYAGMTLSSAWRHYRGRGAQWKGRAYANGVAGRGEAMSGAGVEEGRDA